MDDIDALRARVEAAQEKLGESEAERQRHSDSLIDLINGIESRFTERQREIDAYKGEILRLEQHNAELRQLLDDLLQGVEAGEGSDGLSEAVETLDSTMSAIVATAGPELTPLDMPAAEVNITPEPKIDEPEPQIETLAQEIEAPAREIDEDIETGAPIEPSPSAGDTPLDGDPAVIEALLNPGSPAEEAIDLVAGAGPSDPQPSQDEIAPAEAAAMGASDAEAVSTDLIAPDGDETASGDPTTVKDIIERVSRLADEMAETVRAGAIMPDVQPPAPAEPPMEPEKAAAVS